MKDTFDSSKLMAATGRAFDDMFGEDRDIKIDVRQEPECFGSACNDCEVYPCDAIRVK